MANTVSGYTSTEFYRRKPVLKKQVFLSPPENRQVTHKEEQPTGNNPGGSTYNHSFSRARCHCEEAQICIANVGEGAGSHSDCHHFPSTGNRVHDGNLLDIPQHAAAAAAGAPSRRARQSGSAASEAWKRFLRHGGQLR